MRRRLARAAAVVALLWLGGCASAGGSRPVALAKPTRAVLPNGVVLIVQEHRASDVVALQLWMRMGGRDEAANELGLAHYIEHMLFKGTPTHNNVMKLLQDRGAQFNGTMARRQMPIPGTGSYLLRRP